MFLGEVINGYLFPKESYGLIDFLTLVIFRKLVEKVREKEFEFDSLRQRQN